MDSCMMPLRTRLDDETLHTLYCMLDGQQVSMFSEALTWTSAGSSDFC